MCEVLFFIMVIFIVHLLELLVIYLIGHICFIVVSSFFIDVFYGHRDFFNGGMFPLESHFS
jgi:hypothetical protein